MDTRFLITFIEVVNTRHFGKAAENLYLTQSAVSARIKLLEEYFQAPLFERHRNSIQLTPAGEKLLPYAINVCDTLSQARIDIQTASSNILVVGATQRAGESVLAQVLQQLRGICKGWTVKANVMSIDGLSRRLHERMIDIAISTEPLKSEDTQHSVLSQQPLGLFRVNYTGPIEAAAFVSIDWGTKNNDAVIAQYPLLRDASTFTNMLHIADATLRQQGGLVVLPIDDVSHLNAFPEATLVAPIEGAMVTYYLNTMKTVRRAGLSAIIARITESLHLPE